jgi:uncharacterized protein (DUF362 family)
MSRDKRSKDTAKSLQSEGCPRTHNHGLGKGDHRQGATRREFLRNTALGTAGLVIGSRIVNPGALLATGNPAPKNSKIVRAYHEDATSGLVVNQEPVSDMVHAAVKELTGIADLAAAWKSLFPGIHAAQRVSIKINLACGDVPTHPEVVNAIIEGLRMMDLGGEQLPEENIIVWDWDNAFFCAQTGYPQNWGGPGVQYVGTDHPSLGFDYGVSFPIHHPHDSTTNHSPSKLLTQHTDHLINAGVIKDHSDSGVTLCLKNHYGSFSGIPVSQMHTHSYYGDGHTRGEPELNRVLRDKMGDKTRLFLVDSILGLYDGGPGYIPPYHTPPNWVYNSVIVGFDPVAVDRVGTVKINEERVRNGVATVDPSHVYTSADEPYNLGTDDMASIDLVEIDAANPTGLPLSPAAMSGGIKLMNPYPNPAQQGCTIRFECAAEARAKVTIVDVRGRKVRQIASSRFSAGDHNLPWDGKDDAGRMLASGVYFCKMETAGAVLRQKLMVLR